LKKQYLADNYSNSVIVLTKFAMEKIVLSFKC